MVKKIYLLKEHRKRMRDKDFIEAPSLKEALKEI